MRVSTKENSAPDTKVALLDQSWGFYLPALPDTRDFEDMGQIDAALQQAELVIRAQEERIRLLESMALADDLTGLANRRSFMMALERELSFARRDSDYKGILVMVDLDGFKSINDTWGHQAGDIYLRTVAEALRDGVRGTDIVARLGGDEFALLFPSMNEEVGLRRLQRLEQNFCKRVASLQENIPLRASFGLASYAGSDKAEAVMNTADLRLYAHKARNKNLISARE